MASGHMKSVHEEPLPPAHQNRGTRPLAEYLRDPAHVRSVAINGLFVLALFYTLYFGRPFFLPVTLALFLDLLLSPAVRALARWHIPRGVGAALVLAAVLGIVVYALTRISQPAAEWLQQAPKDWQQFERKVDGLIRPVAEFNKAARKVQDVADGTEGEKNTPKVEVKSSPNLMTYALGWTKDFGAKYRVADPPVFPIGVRRYVPTETGGIAATAQGQKARRDNCPRNRARHLNVSLHGRHHQLLSGRRRRFDPVVRRDAQSPDVGHNGRLA